MAVLSSSDVDKPLEICTPRKHLNRCHIDAYLPGRRIERCAGHVVRRQNHFLETG